MSNRQTSWLILLDLPIITRNLLHISNSLLNFWRTKSPRNSLLGPPLVWMLQLQDCVGYNVYKLAPSLNFLTKLIDLSSKLCYLINIMYWTVSCQLYSKTQQYNLRPRSHNLTQTYKSTFYDNCNFITRMLFKESYWHFLSYLNIDVICYWYFICTALQFVIA